MSFGFSYSLWSLTQNFLEANPVLRGSSGLQVVVLNLGLSQTVSGMVPEYVALLNEQSQVLASMPQRFAQDMAAMQGDLTSAGMAPGLAELQAIQFEVNQMRNYFSDEPDAASWLRDWQGVNQEFAAWQNQWSSVFPPYVPGH